MRVIAGSLKGRRLKAPTWDGLRPTSDKLRETLFNVLAPRIAGARVLDGFAGTGALGIEALSRGAAHVTFVERDRRAQALIAENLARCGIADGYAIIRATVARGARDARGRPRVRAVRHRPARSAVRPSRRHEALAAASRRSCSRRTASSCSNMRGGSRRRSTPAAGRAATASATRAAFYADVSG